MRMISPPLQTWQSSRSLRNAVGESHVAAAGALSLRQTPPTRPSLRALSDARPIAQDTKPVQPLRRRVAVYGGAFDPITNAHLTAASELIHTGQVDEIWLVPCGKRPDKPKLKTDPLDRYIMCQIAVNTMLSPDLPVRVSDVECFEPEAMFTYDLLCKLREQSPELDFCFVIGTDWLQRGTNISTWESRNPKWRPGDPPEQKFLVTGDRLLREFEFIVVTRPGYTVENSTEDPTGLRQFGPRLSWLAMPHGMALVESNLSSTEVRARIRRAGDLSNGGPRSLRSVECLVPPGVLSYIQRQRLYL